MIEMLLSVLLLFVYFYLGVCIFLLSCLSYNVNWSFESLLVQVKTICNGVLVPSQELPKCSPDDLSLFIYLFSCGERLSDAFLLAKRKEIYRPQLIVTWGYCTDISALS